MRQFSTAATTAACQAKHRQSNIMLVHNIERSTGSTALKCWTPTCSYQQPFCSSSLQLGIPGMLHCVLNPKTHQKVEASKWRKEQNIGQEPATWHPNPDRRIQKNTKEHAPIIHCILFCCLYRYIEPQQTSLQIPSACRDGSSGELRTAQHIIHNINASSSTRRRHYEYP